MPPNKSQVFIWLKLSGRSEWSAYKSADRSNDEQHPEHRLCAEGWLCSMGNQGTALQGGSTARGRWGCWPRCCGRSVKKEWNCCVLGLLCCPAPLSQLAQVCRTNLHCSNDGEGWDGGIISSHPTSPMELHIALLTDTAVVIAAGCIVSEQDTFLY